jgi:hypothetical protein
MTSICAGRRMGNRRNAALAANPVRILERFMIDSPLPLQNGFGVQRVPSAPLVCGGRPEVRSRRV